MPPKKDPCPHRTMRFVKFLTAKALAESPLWAFGTCRGCGAKVSAVLPKPTSAEEAFAARPRA